MVDWRLSIDYNNDCRSVTIRDLKSRIAPTLVGVFLLSIHSIPSHQLDQELSILPEVSPVRNSLFDTY